MAEKKRDRSREATTVVPETESGTTADRDFGKSDRYTNKDEGRDANFRTMGDGSAWDSGREASIAEGTHVETDIRAADAETPGVKTKPASPVREAEEK
jgi:hypothetical protein